MGGGGEYIMGGGVILNFIINKVYTDKIKIKQFMILVPQSLVWSREELGTATSHFYSWSSLHLYTLIPSLPSYTTEPSTWALLVRKTSDKGGDWTLVELSLWYQSWVTRVARGTTDIQSNHTKETPHLYSVEHPLFYPM